MVPHFLGTGWSFPPSFSLADGTVQMVSGEEDIRQSLGIIFSTNLGERVMRHDFGCNLYSMAFETITIAHRTQLRDLIEIAVLENEPRIVLEKISIEADPHIAGLVLISLDYLIPATNARGNWVYPYYLNEGSQPV
ncbi:MAG: hypothetical protein JWO94_1032 [Verrucomicrobiaceae bacterium]|nr:hypothetical protein [Verrucomicrobiaceae bacterium]